MVEGFVLYGEEALDAFVSEDLEHFFVLDEVGELTLFRELSFLDLDGLRVDIPQELLT